jgi:hypothetical protein
MRMIKIQIPDRDECARGFAALIRRGRVDCFKDNVFVVPERAVSVLQDTGVRYVELAREELDYTQSALWRFPAINPGKRRL